MRGKTLDVSLFHCIDALDVYWCVCLCVEYSARCNVMFVASYRKYAVDFRRSNPKVLRCSL